MPLHPFSYITGTEQDERIQVFYKLAITAAIAGLLIYLVGMFFIQPLLQDIPPVLVNAFLGVPSLLLVYFSLYRKVERSLWKNRFWRRFLGITTPVLDGRWAGEVRVYDKDGKQYQSSPVHLSIMQTWRSICISLSSSRHKSDSQGCSIRLEADGYVIRYTYFAIKKYIFSPPDGESINEHFSHVGNARIYVPITETGDVENRLIKMQFYTENLERGSMHLTKVKHWDESLSDEAENVRSFLTASGQMDSGDFITAAGEQGADDQLPARTESKSP